MPSKTFVSALFTGCIGLLVGCAQPLDTSGSVEATSLLGRQLERPELETRPEYTAALRNAEDQHWDEDASIWVGRQLAYMARYREAINTYTDAIQRLGESPKLLRHRGHRWITIRNFQRAAKDLARAAHLARDLPDEVEPDGLPNEFNLPRSTMQSNIWYHLGLAHYLQGRFDDAADAYNACLDFSLVNDDMRCATTYWLYLSLRRDGRHEQASRVLEPIVQDMDVIENHTYHHLLLMFKGDLAESDAIADGEIESPTSHYGLAVWRLLNNDPAGANEIFHQIVNGDGSWAAFGYIAAEAELSRTPTSPRSAR